MYRIFPSREVITYIIFNASHSCASNFPTGTERSSCIIFPTHHILPCITASHVTFSNTTHAPYITCHTHHMPDAPYSLCFTFPHVSHSPRHHIQLASHSSHIISTHQLYGTGTSHLVIQSGIYAYSVLKMKVKMALCFYLWNGIQQHITKGNAQINTSKILFFRNYIVGSVDKSYFFVFHFKF